LSLAKLGKKRSLETRKKISSSLKISKLVGHKHRLETKLKLSKISLNRKIDPNRGIYISVTDRTTGVIKNYKSIREAAKDLKADTRSLRSRIPNDNGV
jgi:CRISPR/Cas system-associated endonuclease Cas3-HD